MADTLDKNGSNVQAAVAKCDSRMFNIETIKANAKLIVKAPKLLEQNKRMLEGLKTITALCKLKYGNLDAGVWQEIQANEKLIKEIEEAS